MTAAQFDQGISHCHGRCVIFHFYLKNTVPALRWPASANTDLASVPQRRARRIRCRLPLRPAGRGRRGGSGATRSARQVRRTTSRAQGEIRASAAHRRRRDQTANGCSRLLRRMNRAQGVPPGATMQGGGGSWRSFHFAPSNRAFCQAEAQHLGQTRRCLSGRRGQRDAWCRQSRILVLQKERCDHPQHGGRLAGSRAAGDDEKARTQGKQDRDALFHVGIRCVCETLRENFLRRRRMHHDVLQKPGAQRVDDTALVTEVAAGYECDRVRPAPVLPGWSRRARLAANRSRRHGA